MTALSDGQIVALQNLARKLAGETVDWINIADARTLTELGLAERHGGGWRITPDGLTAMTAQAVNAEPESTVVTMRRIDHERK
jgi:hypothetical protein